MRKLLTPGVFFSVLIFSSCGDNSGNSPFSTHEFDLGDRQFAIKLPAEASIQASIDKNLVMMQLQAKTVNSPRITMRMPFSGDLEMREGTSKNLGSSRVLSYRLSTSNVGNKDIKEAFLNGHLVYKGKRYVVSCTIQSKFVTVEQAAWCVEYLKTLQVK